MPNNPHPSCLGALLLAFHYMLAGGFAIVSEIEYTATGQSCSLMGLGKTSCCCKTANVPVARTACLMDAPCNIDAPAVEIQASGCSKHLTGVGPSEASDPITAPAPAGSTDATYPPHYFPIEKIPIPAT